MDRAVSPINTKLPMTTIPTPLSKYARQVSISGAAGAVLAERRTYRQFHGRSRITFTQTLEEMLLEHPEMLAEVTSLRGQLDNFWVRGCLRVGRLFGFC